MWICLIMTTHVVFHPERWNTGTMVRDSGNHPQWYQLFSGHFQVSELPEFSKIYLDERWSKHENMGICHEKMGISYTNMEKHRFFNQQMEDLNHKNRDSCGLIGMNGDLDINLGIQQLKDGGIYIPSRTWDLPFLSFFFPWENMVQTLGISLRKPKKKGDLLWFTIQNDGEVQPPWRNTAI